MQCMDDGTIFAPNRLLRLATGGGSRLTGI